MDIVMLVDVDPETNAKDKCDWCGKPLGETAYRQGKTLACHECRYVSQPDEFFCHDDDRASPYVPTGIQMGLPWTPNLDRIRTAIEGLNCERLVCELLNALVDVTVVQDIWDDDNGRVNKKLVYGRRLDLLEKAFHHPDWDV